MNELIELLTENTDKKTGNWNIEYNKNKIPLCDDEKKAKSYYILHKHCGIDIYEYKSIDFTKPIYFLSWQIYPNYFYEILGNIDHITEMIKEIING